MTGGCKGRELLRHCPALTASHKSCGPLQPDCTQYNARLQRMVRANLVVLAAFAALSISTADDAVLRSKCGAWKEEFTLRVFGLFGAAALSCAFLVPFSLTRTKCSPRQRSSGGSWQRPRIGAPAEGPGCPLGGQADSLVSSLVARHGRSLAVAGALRNSLDGRCLGSRPTDWLLIRAVRARASFRSFRPLSPRTMSGGKDLGSLRASH